MRLFLYFSIYLIVCLFVNILYAHNHQELFKDIGKDASWMKYLPDILCAEYLAFRLDNQTLLFPCLILEDIIGQMKAKWEEDSSLSLPFLEGRRLSVNDYQDMFHASFMPQVSCAVLKRLNFVSDPLIWQGGSLFQTTEGIVCLFMHDVSSAELKKRKDMRKHGIPIRLKTLDILVKGQTSEEAYDLLCTILHTIKDIVRSYWKGLSIHKSVLLPYSIKHFFSFQRPSLLRTIPYDEQVEEEGWQRWEQTHQEILENRGFLTPFHLACHEGDIELLKTQNELPANQPTREGDTGVFFACQNGHELVLRYLLSRDIKLEWNFANDQDLTPAWIVNHENHQNIKDIMHSAEDDYPGLVIECKKRF